MRIAVIGAGYVGLITAACLARVANEVVCVEKNVAKLDVIAAGGVPVYEPGLVELVAEMKAEGRLSFTNSMKEALAGARAAFIGVGTPPRPLDGQADLRWVMEAARDAARLASGPLVLITKSTVPVGTGDEIERRISGLANGRSITVVSNPEFLREGSGITDFMQPDRIVIGAEDDGSRRVLEEIYAPFEARGVPVLLTSRRSAELIKYASNAFLAMKVTYANEMALLCEAAGADASAVLEGLGLDSRIGSKFLKPGPGYGGSCFPKDTLALIRTAQDCRRPLKLVEATVAANDHVKREMAFRIVDACGGSVRNKTVAVLGLAFKAGTDDIRESPSLAIVQALVDRGATVRAYDPQAMKDGSGLPEGASVFRSALDAAEGADVVAVLTEWPEFAELNLVALAKVMAGSVLVDFRNIVPLEKIEGAQLRHFPFR